MMRNLLRAALVSIAASLPVAAAAEALPDPTRPPAAIAAPAAASSVEAAPAPAGLQSIIISRTRRAAIIDGETVELGGKHGDAKLIEVSEGSVVLHSAQGRQVLTLFPDVKITGKRGSKPVAREESK
jgi:MSHA biogenesis protein MshK